MNKGNLTYYFRKFGLMRWVDKIKFVIFKTLNYKRNSNFSRQNPNVILPPDYMVFESFNLDYEKYYFGGKKTAEWIIGLFKKYSNVDHKVFLDWGCGPARITRHLSSCVQNAEIYGTDYNGDTIVWCKKNITSASFSKNDLSKPLDFEDSKFDYIIGISIFTHLSEDNHKFWITELQRVMNVNGIVLLTTMGAAFKAQMTETEILKFDSYQLVTRENVMEGHRTFAAFQPHEYFKNLIANHFEILEFKAGTTKSWGIEQDYWVLKSK